ncbi:chloride channel protein, CIC family [Maridesulfovibrio ferrireducens]|uniref:Chloride channel protein, CIC family n=1 Tax=Maridesulfovibrio ferrireducens TaxID=246191 RepID=A0A1G9FL66_9BACT|nr:chloride channel protein [Maridesulfovibrio ferrireducens]SDK89120.1 chloride channel protein, CIC family [Maridesulfovibrio ferrireducens]
MSPLLNLRVWKEIARSYKNISSFRWLLLGVLVGLLSGILAVAFFAAVEYGKFIFLHQLAGMTLPAPAGEEIFHGPAGQLRPWVIPVCTMTVGLITGWLVNKYIPETISGGTDGTDATIKCFHQGSGLMRPIVPIIKGITSVFTIATGGSAGREGPITQMGAGIGSWIAQKLKLSAKERRILLLAGAAGGLGAIFRAPLGGALTAVEVIYREDFESEAILPSVLSSVVSYSLFTLFYGAEPIFGIPRFVFHDPREMIFYIILAFACTLVGWMYIRTFRFIKYSIFFKIKDRLGLMWATGLGGLMMGLMGMFFPQLLSGGYGWLEMAIMGEIPIMMMIAIILGKTVATSMTIGSGMSGGMFAPALFVGGMTGGIVGQVAGKYYPDIATQPGAYVLVGMAAFFAGVAKAPIGPLIMVCELTQGYGLLAPLMLASALCIVLGRNCSLYEHQVDNKFDSPAHIEDSTINILEQLHVDTHFKPGRVTTLEEGTTLKALRDIIANTNELYFPVKNDEGTITGILTIQNVRNHLFNQDLFDLILAKDLATKPATLKEDDDLYTALLKFVDTDYGQIPVVSEDDPNHIIGIINRENVFRAYAKAIKELHED